MINKVILMGRLTADPEMKQTNSGTAYCKFSVAVNRSFADKQTGERQADFINVTAWGKTAEFVTKYFHKGSMIIVEGELRNNNYTDGNGIKHYSMDVYASNVAFSETKAASQGQQTTQQPSQPAYQPQPTNNPYMPNQPAVPPVASNTAYPQQNPYIPPTGGQPYNIGFNPEVLPDGDVPF